MQVYGVGKSGSKDGYEVLKLSLENLGIDVANEIEKDSNGDKIGYAEICDIIENIKIDVAEINNSWKDEISSSNQTILGERPISRSNDARIKKLELNTKNIIDKNANKIEEYMERLDSIAASLDINDNLIVETIKLINFCFESLHMEYDLFIKKGKNILVKYEVQQKYSNISKKWKKKYNSIPNVKILKLKEKIKTNKKELVAVKRRITVNKKKKEASEKKYAEDIESSLKTINNNETIIVEKNNQIKHIESMVIEFNESIKNNDSLIKNFNKDLNSEKKTYKSIDIQFWNELREYDSKTYKIIEERKMKEFALYVLAKEEQKKRSKANKSFVFRKKKLEEADFLLAQINNIKDVIKQLNDDIDRNNQIILGRQNEYSRNKEKRSNLIDSIQLKIKTVNSQIKDDKSKVQDLENRKKALCDEIEEIQRNSNEIKFSLEAFKEERDSLSAKIEEDIRRQDDLELLIKQYNEELSDFGKN